jgi:hypothetical protein
VSESALDLEHLREEFTTTVGEPLGAGQMIHDPQQKYRMLVMVSRRVRARPDPPG